MMFLKLFHRIHDFTGQGLNNIIIYKIVTHNFLFFWFSLYHSFCWNL